MASKTKTRTNSAKPSRLDDLKFDPQNARRHPERNLAMIQESMTAVGAARSIVIDEGGIVRAGEGSVRAARELGLKLRVVEADGKTLIAVRRRGLTKEQKTALALYDNRTAELAEWDPAVLKALVDAGGVNLSSLFSDKELQAILAGEIDAELQGGHTDPDDVPAVRKTRIKPGDLFALGHHRLLCGDSTDADQVARLMDGQRALLFATDPPYLVDYDGQNHPQKWGDSPTKNKNWSGTYREWDASTQGVEFYEHFVKVAIEVAIDPRAAWYCWHASRRQAMLEQVWEKAGAFVHQQLIWVKTRPVLTRSVYLWQHEPCFFGWTKSKKPFVRKGFEDGHPTTVWAIPSSEVESKDHPTSKPTRCFTLPMQLHTQPGDVCFEPFSGSGSQIIAAEQTQRRCFALEIEPVFIQVAIDRWEAFTGQKAQHLGNARTGPKAAAAKQDRRARSTK